MRDLGVSVAASDDLAFAHSINRLVGTMTNGVQAGLWVRWTACFRKTDSRWSIAHFQVSVPVDLASGKGAMDLTP